MFLPGILAVGGGINAVLVPFGLAELAELGLGFLAAFPAGFPFGVGVPPYFFNSSCVVLYFVAVLSFSMVLSLCFCKLSR